MNISDFRGAQPCVKISWDPAMYEVLITHLQSRGNGTYSKLFSGKKRSGIIGGGAAEFFCHGSLVFIHGGANALNGSPKLRAAFFKPGSSEIGLYYVEVDKLAEWRTIAGTIGTASGMQEVVGVAIDQLVQQPPKFAVYEAEVPGFSTSGITSNSTWRIKDPKSPLIVFGK